MFSITAAQSPEGGKKQSVVNNSQRLWDYLAHWVKLAHKAYEREQGDANQNTKLLKER